MRTEDTSLCFSRTISRGLPSAAARGCLDFRSQHKLDGDVRPIIVNVTNFIKGADGEPTPLSLDDARTLFHEFGHALHGMLSDVTYPLRRGNQCRARLRGATLAAL